VLFIATAQALDDEMRARIADHQKRRPGTWHTLELPTGVGRFLVADAPREGIILLDCLTLLVSNVLRQAAPDMNHIAEAAVRAAVEQEIELLERAIREQPARWLVVSNEVGQGVVPPYVSGRLFRDLLGWANRQLAAKADEVIWMVAGIPVPIGQHRWGLATHRSS